MDTNVESRNSKGRSGYIVSLILQMFSSAQTCVCGENKKKDLSLFFFPGEIPPGPMICVPKVFWAQDWARLGPKIEARDINHINTQTITKYFVSTFEYQTKK